MTRTVTIKWRRDTAANWTSADSVLAEGEAGYETDTDKLKIGDGTTAWTSLSYWTGGSAIGDVDGPASATDNAIAVYNGTTGKIIKDSKVLVSSDGDVTIGATGKGIFTSANGETGSIWRDNDNLYVDSGASGSVVVNGATGTYLKFNSTDSLSIFSGRIAIYDDVYLREGERMRFYNDGNTEYGIINRDNDYLNINSGDGGEIRMIGSGNVAFDISTAGITTFASFPITPSAAPTTDYQVANKKYVDDTAVGSTYTASNSGTGSGVFYQKTGTDFEFMSIKQGANMTITTVGSEMTFAASGGIGSQLTADLDVNGNSIDGYTASRALVTTANGSISPATTTATEIGYVNGVTSAIQTQLSTKVTGPAGATNNAIPRFNGATGYIIENSALTITDNGSISSTGSAGIISSKNIRFRVGAGYKTIFENSAGAAIGSITDNGSLSLDGNIDIDGTYQVGGSQISTSNLSDGVGSANNNILLVDSADANQFEICRFTGNGIEGRTNTEMKTQLGYIEDLVDDTTPTMGGHLDMDSKYQYDSYVAADSFVLGQVGYIDPTGSVSLATNKSVGSATLRLVMASATISSGNAGNFVKWGEVGGLSGYSVGSVYYLGATLGSLSTGSVQATGSVSRIVGYGGIAATKFDFEPSREWIVRS